MTKYKIERRWKLIRLNTDGYENDYPFGLQRLRMVEIGDFLSEEDVIAKIERLDDDGEYQIIPTLKRGIDWDA